MFGGGGEDVLRDGRGQDYVRGGPGDDTLRGGHAIDRFLAGPRDDFVHTVGKGRDLVNCGPGDDAARVGVIDRSTPTVSASSAAGAEHRRGKNVDLVSLSEPI